MPELAKVRRNPITQAARQRQGGRPGLVVLDTNSPGCTWRPAAGARLARMSDFANHAAQSRANPWKELAYDKRVSRWLPLREGEISDHRSTHAHAGVPLHVLPARDGEFLLRRVHVFEQRRGVR